MMILSEFALVILLDEIIEVQKGLDWVKNSSENQYQTSIQYVTFVLLFSIIHISMPA